MALESSVSCKAKSKSVWKLTDKCTEDYTETITTTTAAAATENNNNDNNNNNFFLLSMAGYFFIVIPILSGTMAILTYFHFFCAQDLIYTEFFSQGDKVRSL